MRVSGGGATTWSDSYTANEKQLNPLETVAAGCFIITEPKPLQNAAFTKSWWVSDERGGWAVRKRWGTSWRVQLTDDSRVWTGTDLWLCIISNSKHTTLQSRGSTFILKIKLNSPDITLNLLICTKRGFASTKIWNNQSFLILNKQLHIAHVQKSHYKWKKILKQ